MLRYVATSQGDARALLAVNSNVGATRDPLPTDDLSKGFDQGSVWINLTAGELRTWQCLDATAGNAAWGYLGTCFELGGTDPPGAPGGGGGGGLTQAQADILYVSKAGDTMTGPLNLSGALAANKGINWQDNGTPRWRFITDTSENLALYSYDATGAFIGTPVSFNWSNQTALFGFPIITTNVNATVAGGVTGTQLNSRNTGPNAAQGQKFSYFSASGGSGFDIGLTNIAIFDPVFVAGQTPAMQGIWFVSQSANDTANRWGCNVGELDVVNRGPDCGWMRDRTTPNPTGVLLAVAESQTFGGTGGGEGKNASYGFTVSRSAAPNSTGFPAKFYNCFLAEPNSAVGLTGRAIYVTGDITGVASQYPYGPLQTDGTWLHGIDHTKATYTDGAAQTFGSGQAMRWIVGPTTAPTASATITGTGAGANAALTLTPAGTGIITLAGPAPLASGGLTVGNATNAGTLIRLNAATASSPAIQYDAAGVLRWSVALDNVAENPGTNVGSNLTIYAYADAGGFLGTALQITRSTMAVKLGGSFAAFNAAPPAAKPTVTGAKGSNAALASLLTALVAYGLVTDSTTA